MSPFELRVAIVEDSVLLREGIVRLLEEAGFTCVGAWGDADDLVPRLVEVAANVVIVDVRLPPTFRDEGMIAAGQVRRELEGVGVLVLSQYVEGLYARELLAAGNGGVGYLLKDRITSLPELSDAVSRVAAGGTVLDPVVVAELMTSQRNPLAALTPREHQVLELMAEGNSNSRIAQRLTVSVGAVEKHTSAIFAKLGLEDSATENRRVHAVLAWLQRLSA